MTRSKLQIQPRLRFPASHPRAFGPGKAELLQHIAETGSISKAALRMKMSYNRAWLLVRDMNRLFRQPLVTAARGGRVGGGASVTPLGRDTIVRYVRMEAACRKATRRDWGVLARRLRP